MKRFLSVLLVMLSVLVVAHAVIPHHHHRDRIYLLIEENHEQHESGEPTSGTCHHGNSTAEVLVNAAQSLSSPQKNIQERYAPLPYGIFLLPRAEETHAAPMAVSGFPDSPLRMVRGMRAPPYLLF